MRPALLIRLLSVPARSSRLTRRVTHVWSKYPIYQMKRKASDTISSSYSKRARSDMATAQVKLTQKETQLRAILLDVARYIDESKEIKEKLEIRFAGGWIRDKLLNIQSHDIDAAINATTGLHFCSKLQEYFKDPENMKKHDLKSDDLGNLYTVPRNPDKSKHLETATKIILGFDVDFVNLRKETYTEDSRNPQMEFGTAKEDALRRDATINALFYNLHCDAVEDYAGGLQDLKDRRIRTPLEPKTTFTDDPLRVLRLIRFASRLDFTIDEDVEVCMSDPDVMEALRNKISRERVGVEVEKMLRGNNPKGSLSLFDRLGLYQAIFTDPTALPIITPSTTNWHVAYDCLELLKKNETPGSIYHSLVRSDDAKYFAWILAAITPWSAIPKPPRSSGGKQPLPLGVLAAREGIKTENKITSVLTGAFRHYEEICTLKDAIVQKESHINERDTVGMSIRRWDGQGGNWRLQALFGLLVEAMNSPSSGYETLFSEWQAFIDHLEKMQLMDAPSIKSIIDGKQLSKALGVKPGIWMKSALDLCMAWQLRNPDAEGFEGAVEEVKSKKEMLKIPM